MGHFLATGRRTVAEMLSDQDLKKIIGSVIVDGDPSSVRPNSYVLRLGAWGEFLNSGKAFELGGAKKGIRIAPGHSVGVTAREKIDFSRDVVDRFFPNHDLHGVISPTTDLAREGIVAPTTQVDAGYHGTLNWTIVNTSSQERRFVYEERCFRLTILKLAAGERPEQLYAGDYQGREGYVPSHRRGAPTGMKEYEWEDSTIKGGPEEMLQSLIKSGYPWSVLGERLMALDGQFKTVTNEYADIQKSMVRIENEMSSLRDDHGNLTEKIRKAVSDQISAILAPLTIRTVAFIMCMIGLWLTIWSSPPAMAFLESHGAWVGLLVIIAALAVSFLYRNKPPDS